MPDQAQFLDSLVGLKFSGNSTNEPKCFSSSCARSFCLMVVEISRLHSLKRRIIQ
jgi:hypothetical protein